MPVTITASGNSTPPANTIIATRQVGSQEYQQFIPVDNSGSPIGQAAASPFHVAAQVTNRAGSAAGSPLFVSATNLAGSAAGSPLFVSACITNFAGSAAGSPLFVTQNNMAGSAAGSPIFSSITNLAGSAAGSPLFVSACVTNLAGSAAGSPLFASITNQISASVSGGSVALLAGANTIGAASAIQSGAWSVAASIVNSPSVVVVSALASPVFASITNSGGSAAGSPLFVSASITNLAGSAAGSPLFASITNLAGSAAGSPLFVTQTNMAGSAAGSPLFVSACITNLAGSAAGSPLFTRLTDGTDTAFVDAASRLAVALTDGTNAYGLPGSPLAQTGEGQKIWWGGSLLTVQQADLSASSSGCTRIVASGAGQAIVVVAATFTTSSCQFIGWVASGAGAASARVQTPMPFGTNGGMNAERLPHGYLWAFPSGSNAVMTTTSACNVAGTLNYLMVAS